jgi:hypothetical protein
VHASCRPYVSVVSARQEFIYFPASAIDHVGSVRYQGELILLVRDVVFPISCGCRLLWEECSWELPLALHNGRKGRGNITSISLSTLCSSRKEFPPTSVPNCHICFGNALGRTIKGSSMVQERVLSMQSTTQLESTIQMATGTS